MKQLNWKKIKEETGRQRANRRINRTIADKQIQKQPLNRCIDSSVYQHKN